MEIPLLIRVRRRCLRFYRTTHVRNDTSTDAWPESTFCLWHHPSNAANCTPAGVLSKDQTRWMRGLRQTTIYARTWMSAVRFMMKRWKWTSSVLLAFKECDGKCFLLNLRAAPTSTKRVGLRLSSNWGVQLHLQYVLSRIHPLSPRERFHDTCIFKIVLPAVPHKQEFVAVDINDHTTSYSSFDLHEQLTNVSIPLLFHNHVVNNCWSLHCQGHY